MSATAVARNPLTYIIGAAGVFGIALAVILVATSRTAPAQTTIRGTYDLTIQYGRGCSDDEAGIRDGAPVWVFDEPGHPLASGRLMLVEPGRSVCKFTFEVTSGSAPVWVQVGGQSKVRLGDLSAPVSLRS